jgi:hypothetical protein
MGYSIGSRFFLDLAWLVRVLFIHEGVELLLKKLWPEPLTELAMNVSSIMQNTVKSDSLVDWVVRLIWTAIVNVTLIKYHDCCITKLESQAKPRMFNRNVVDASKVCMGW